MIRYDRKEEEEEEEEEVPHREVLRLAQEPTYGLSALHMI